MPLADTLIFDRDEDGRCPTRLRRPLPFTVSHYTFRLAATARSSNIQNDSVDAGASGNRKSTSSISHEVSWNRCRSVLSVVVGLRRRVSACRIPLSARRRPIIQRACPHAEPSRQFVASFPREADIADRAVKMATLSDLQLYYVYYYVGGNRLSIN